jgi:hypothetical protein
MEWFKGSAKIERVDLKKVKVKKRFYFRTCRRCGLPFRSSSKYGKICDKCNLRPEYNKTEKFI